MRSLSDARHLATAAAAATRSGRIGGAGHGGRGACGRRGWHGGGRFGQSAAAAAALTACLVLVLPCAGANLCDELPECTDEPYTVVRIWLPKIGRVQKACDPDAQWTSDCVGDCLGAYADTSWNAAYFNDTRTGWMAGESGALVKSTDGGVSWVVKDTRMAGTIYGIHFPTMNIGYIVGSLGSVGTSLDGGESWSWRYDMIDGVSNMLYAVHFFNATTGWIVGSSGRIYRTLDGGTVWMVEAWDNGKDYYSVHFADHAAGLVTGSHGRLLWSKDGGNTWARGATEADTDASQVSFRAGHCVNGTHGFAVGSGGFLLRTQDGGSTWHAPPGASTSPSMFFLGVDFAPGGLAGWAVGQRGEPPAAGLGLLLETKDGGETWTEHRRTGLLNQRLNAAVSVAEVVPQCPSTTTDEPFEGERTTVTKTTTTVNAEASAVKDAQLELLTVLTAGGNQTRFARNESAAVVTAQVINFGAALQQGGYASVKAENSDLEVAVPASALAGIAEDAVLVVTQFTDNGGKPAWDTDPSAQEAMEGTSGVQALAAPPVAIDLGVGGAFASVRDLEEPIILRLMERKVPGYECAFWNETTKKWSAEGVTEVYNASSGALTCATTHLSVFAAVWKDVLYGLEQALTCSNINAVSPAGFVALGEGLACSGDNCVWTNVAFWVFWIFVSFQVYVFFWALRHDRNWRGAGLWSSKTWLTENFQFVRPETTLKEAITEQYTGFRSDPSKRLSVIVSTMCIQHAVATKLRVAAGDLPVLLEWARKTVEHPEEDSKATRAFKIPGPSADGSDAEGSAAAAEGAAGDLEDAADAEELRQTKKKKMKALKKAHREAKLIAFVPNIYECMDEQAKLYQEFASSRRRLILFLKYFFLSSHPWMSLSYFSILTPAKEQAMLLSCQVFGSMLASSMWYQSSDSSTFNADPKCVNSTKMGVIIGRAVGVSFLSLFCATVPIIGLRMLLTRDFMYKEHWSKKDIKEQLKAWRIKRIAFWIISVVLLVFSVIFCTSFLANVRQADGLKWLLSACILLVKLSLLVPALQGLAIVVLAMLSVKKYDDPELQQEARDRLKLRPDEDLEKQLAESAAGEIEAAEVARRPCLPPPPQYGAASPRSPVMSPGRRSVPTSPGRMARALAAGQAGGQRTSVSASASGLRGAAAAGRGAAAPESRATRAAALGPAAVGGGRGGGTRGSARVAPASLPAPGAPRPRQAF